jgi:hypothetical protein
MTKDEALKLALKALRFAGDDGYQNEVSQQAITAIKQARSAPEESVATEDWEGAEYWMPLAWELCADECGEDACNELIWEGGPIPEPWGDRWLKYEDEAKRLIALVQKHTTPPAAPVQEPESFEQWNAKQHGDPEEIGFLQALRIAYCAGQDSVTKTTPPAAQREWVGLSEEEIDKLKHLIDWTATWSHGRFAYEIEQLLKEKNA